jgi:hypothetical protein
VVKGLRARDANIILVIGQEASKIAQLKQLTGKGAQIPPSPTFCSIRTLSRLGDAQPYYNCTDSNANLIQRNPHRYTQKQYLIWVQSS